MRAALGVRDTLTPVASALAGAIAETIADQRIEIEQMVGKFRQLNETVTDFAKGASDKTEFLDALEKIE
jgi:hypothetical protein